MGKLNPPSKARTSIISIVMALSAMGVSMPRALAGCGAAVSTAPVISLNPAAVGKEADVDDGKGADCNELRCDGWLQLQQKEVLLKLLKSYYAMSVEGKGGNPAEAELMSKLAARVVASN